MGLRLEAREERYFSKAEIAVPLEQLVYEQWLETGQYRAPYVKYQPNFQQIFHLNDLGLYRVILLWTGGELVGYLFFHLAPSLHTSSLVATHDIFFVRKDWRIGRGALLLLREADKVCEELGVREVYAAHVGGDSMTKLMTHTDYKVIGSQCYKVLGGQEV